MFSYEWQPSVLNFFPAMHYVWFWWLSRPLAALTSSADKPDCLTFGNFHQALNTSPPDFTDSFPTLILQLCAGTRTSAPDVGDTEMANH